MAAPDTGATAAPQGPAPEPAAPEIDIDYWTLLCEARIIRVG